MESKPNGGIYFERKVFLSDAYKSLGKNARMVLLAMLDARQKNPAYKPKGKGFRSERFIDLDKIKMPYVKLHEKYGIRKASIPRALDQLLAAGFIKIQHVVSTDSEINGKMIKNGQEQRGKVDGAPSRSLARS